MAFLLGAPDDVRGAGSVYVALRVRIDVRVGDMGGAVHVVALAVARHVLRQRALALVLAAQRHVRGAGLAHLGGLALAALGLGLAAAAAAAVHLRELVGQILEGLVRLVLVV